MYKPYTLVYSSLMENDTITIELDIVTEDAPLDQIMASLTENLPVEWKLSREETDLDWPTVRVTGPRKEILTVLDRFYTGAMEPTEALIDHQIS